METAAIPAVRIPPELRRAAEELLAVGETLSGFVAVAVRRHVDWRRARVACIDRGPVARDLAPVAGRSMKPTMVLGKLERRPTSARQGIRVAGRLSFLLSQCGGEGAGPFLREFIIPFGNSGHVAPFEIEAGGHVTLLAARHRREDGYH